MSPHKRPFYKFPCLIRMTHDIPRPALDRRRDRCDRLWARNQNNHRTLQDCDRRQKLFISGSRQSSCFISNLSNIFRRANGRACLLIDGLLLLFLYGPVVLLGSPLQLVLLLGLRRGGYQRLALAGVAA